MLRRHSLERRLFGWMLVLALAPALGLLAAGAWIWAGSLDWFGTLGPWDRVAESGRVVFDAAESAAAADPALAAALDRHREELSASLVLAHRGAFLGDRVAAVLPAITLALALFLTGVAYFSSRRLARELARPIGELAEWAERLGREEALPEPCAGESREVREVRALRAAFRRAACELAEARKRAIEAERIRIWGEMARRVAHEMKNPLTPLRLAAHRLARSTVGDPAYVEPLAVIEEEIGRLEELAQQFAALGRPPSGPTSAIDLRELVASLLETDVPPPVEAELEAAGEVPLVEGHHEALVRAFRNLIRNAVESMEGMDHPRRVEVRIGVVVAGAESGAAAGGGGGGAGELDAALRIGSEDGSSRDASPGGSPGSPAREWVEVRIADRGVGLPAGVGDRIFEPDFTTKSRGTGLGLALVRQAVAAHGGVVRAEARPGGGTEFVVRLPATAERVAATV